MKNKIPVLYVFNFTQERISKAIQRLQCSFDSIKDQTDKIFILNASKVNFALNYSGSKLVIIHKPFNGYFNKCKLINYMVKHYLQDYEYFLHSDIDIVYRDNYVENMHAYINYPIQPVRVIPRNIAMPIEYYSSDYEKLWTVAKNFRQHPSGEAPGIGLIHVPSFMMIRGYNESFNGWGSEDREFNDRISRINKFIYDRNIDHIHLWHEAINREHHEQNRRLFNNSIQKTALKNIIRNNESWGEYGES
jgi:predicted glycosyltransferase involved in capsule biosynthesis